MILAGEDSIGHGILARFSGLTRFKGRATIPLDHSLLSASHGAWPRAAKGRARFLPISREFLKAGQMDIDNRTHIPRGVARSVETR